MNLLRVFAILTLALTVVAGPVGATDKPSAEALAFFESKVRPVLANQCTKCHGQDKQKGKLRLDSRAHALQGGETAPAIVPGDPEKSLLITAVKHQDEFLEMPPKKKLRDSEIDALVKWIRMGAPWPEDQAGIQRLPANRITADDRAYWFYQPLKRPDAPQLKHTSNQRLVLNPIDTFILAKLEPHGLTLAPEADRVTLIRRATFDLTGLPPTPKEIDAFVRDRSPNAYEKLIDRLLASPRYGERWARHWLDLVRYADSDGYKQDAYRPHIWRYRNWVIKAFNNDMPYDQFVQYQLAGDELDTKDPDAVIATGYLRLWPYEFNQRDVRNQWGHIIDNITDVSGKVFLGMSVGCARCHDHKFDPILREDYFQLQAFFGTIEPDDSIVAASDAQQAEYRKQFVAWEKATESVRAKIDKIERPHREALEKQAFNLFNEDLRRLLSSPLEKLSPRDQQVKSLAHRQILEQHKRIESKIKGETRKQWEALKKELATYDHLKPKPLTPVMAVRDIGPIAPKTVIPGDATKRPIAPGYPTVLNPKTPDIQQPSGNGRTTGRRLTLARWITHPENQLSTRVIANRIWQHHFGVGIVDTPNDFGRQGGRPSHPQLLDWLATEFVRKGWRFKPMHRLIMTSAAYRQRSLIETPSSAQAADQANRLLWRQRVRRLEAEALRDAMLSVSEELDSGMALAGVDEKSNKRSVYLKIMRNNRPPFMDAFDGPDGFNSFATRSETTTAPQSLMLINGEWALSRARKMADRVARSKPSDPKSLIQNAYRIAFGRDAEADEVAAGVAFLSQQAAHVKPPEAVKAPKRDRKTLAKIMTAAKLNPYAADIDVNAGQYLSTKVTDAFRFDAFTIEAVIYLEGLAKDAKVRVIASQWNGDTKRRGWSFGVTSERSRYQPRNLILQFVGDTRAGKQPTYEVVASDLRPQLNRFYRVVASVKLADTTKSGITFYMQDLSRPSAIETAWVAHSVTANVFSDSPFVVGGRHASAGHGWQGLIGRVRLFNKVMTFEELSKRQPRPFVAGNQSPLVGAWEFNGKDWLKDTSGRGHDLTSQGATRWSATGDPQGDASLPVSREAIVDFCHVLLNANEFMYVD